MGRGKTEEEKNHENRSFLHANRNSRTGFPELALAGKDHRKDAARREKQEDTYCNHWSRFADMVWDHSVTEKKKTGKGAFP